MNEYLDKVINTLNEGTLPDWISDHVRVYEETGGREGHMWDSTAVGGKGLVPCLLLTTVGRQSGKWYTHPLLYGVDGNNPVIVASKGGADTQLHWYFNLLSTPDISVQVKSDKFHARAILAEGEQRARLWELMTNVYPPYIEYQAKTSREIPIFSLERVSGKR